MSVDYTLTLSPEQRQFASLLDTQPRLKPYWDFEKREVDIKALEKGMGVMSHGERVMAQFLLGIWFNENRYKFDLFDAVGVLDTASTRTMSSAMAASSCASPLFRAARMGFR